MNVRTEPLLGALGVFPLGAYGGPPLCEGTCAQPFGLRFAVPSHAADPVPPADHRQRYYNPAQQFTVVAENGSAPEDGALLEDGSSLENGALPENRPLPENGAVSENRAVPENGAVPENRARPESGVLPENKTGPAAGRYHGGSDQSFSGATGGTRFEPCSDVTED